MTTRLDDVTVLVLDDDETQRDLMTMALERFGARVVTCDCAVTALEHLEQKDEPLPDLILSDVAMPEVDGLTFVKRVRASLDPELRKVIVIAVTANSSSEDRRRARTAGFDLLLAKPTPPSEVAMTIASMLERRSTSGMFSSEPALVAAAAAKKAL